MKKKILLYAIFLAVSLIGTLLFLCYNHIIYATFPLSAWMSVLWHSVPQHLTVGGYLLALPLLLELLRIWAPDGSRLAFGMHWHRRFMLIYVPLVCAIVFFLWAANVVIYSYWGIVLDDTAYLYLEDNPIEAFQEAPTWSLIAATICITIIVWLMVRAMRALYPKSSQSLRADAEAMPTSVSQYTRRTLLCLLLCGLDFLAIRGGWTTSTMNPGRAYFSNDMPLNHAAVDPIFNFYYSFSRTQDFSRQYRFMTDDEATAALAQLNECTQVPALDNDTLPLLRTTRPNILLILFESFSGSACHYLTPDADPGWMPNFCQCMREGLAFTHFYGNSFRTDRGVAAVLASYPGQPTHSVMKDQAKCNHLQYLTKRLREEGYRQQFIHGGDVNFTNMKGFLTAGGIDNIVGDSDFPLSERLSKWGVPDGNMFDYVYQQVTAEGDGPWMKTFLTLSSHEPFDVPFHHYDNVYLNSVAYADSCLGAFIGRLKADTAVWNDLLIIGVPDHCFAKYPETIEQHDPLRYHIPMFWVGGALVQHSDTLGHVSQHRDIDVLGQQTDISATLLSQLHIHHEDFNFSRNMLDPHAGHYAFYAFSDGFGLITPGCQYVQDNKRPGVGLQPGTHDPDGHAQRWGEAYLQKLYDDLSNR